MPRRSGNEVEVSPPPRPLLHGYHDPHWRIRHPRRQVLLPARLRRVRCRGFSCGLGCGILSLSSGSGCGSLLPNRVSLPRTLGPWRLTLSARRRWWWTREWRRRGMRRRGVNHVPPSRRGWRTACGGQAARRWGRHPWGSVIAWSSRWGRRLHRGEAILTIRRILFPPPANLRQEVEPELA